ncbi:unnamed protein product, partial [Staurois parvus]
RTVLLATTKPRHIHRIARQRSVIGSLQRTRLLCSRVQWRLAEWLLFPVASTLL